MHRLTVEFRGREVEVEFQNHGYDEDTGGAGVEWWFVDPAMELVQATDEEYEAIALLCMESRYEFD